MSISTEISRVDRWLLSVALIFIIIIAMKTVSFIVTLFLMSIILTLLCLPSVDWLKKRGLSNFHATVVVTVLGILIMLGFVFFTMLSFNSLMASIPQYQSELNNRIEDINALLDTYGISITTDGQPLVKIGDIVQYGYTGFMSLLEAVEFLFFVAIMTFFMLLDAPRVATLFEERLGRNSETSRQMNLLIGYVTDFIVVRTETNFIHGLLFGGFLGLIGVHGAIMWGVLTFLLGYIPYIGLLIAAIPAIFFAWLQFGLPGALAVIVVVGILNLLVENPIYSFLAARKFEMPALIVIISVIFWGWLMGLVGMLFSIPFTLLLLLLFEMVEELRWINVALGVNHLFKDHKKEKTGN
jgi:predicted PurR-regulated permease PerM